MALSDENGSFDFYVSSGNPPNAEDDYYYGNKSSSLLPPDKHLEVTPWVKFKKETVKASRLDTIKDELDIAKIDFIHIDVQGAELKVLKGLGSLLDTVLAVWMEVERIPLYKDQPLHDEVADFMQSRNFGLAADFTESYTGDQFWCRVAR
jgi:FkbM family methyltransferase